MSMLRKERLTEVLDRLGVHENTVVIVCPIQIEQYWREEAVETLDVTYSRFKFEFITFMELDKFLEKRGQDLTVMVDDDMHPNQRQMLGRAIEKYRGTSPFFRLFITRPSDLTGPGKVDPEQMKLLHSLLNNRN